MSIRRRVALAASGGIAVIALMAGGISLANALDLRDAGGEVVDTEPIVGTPLPSDTPTPDQTEPSTTPPTTPQSPGSGVSDPQPVVPAPPVAPPAGDDDDDDDDWDEDDWDDDDDDDWDDDDD